MANAALKNENVYNWINEKIPFSTCEAWDNSGLLAGSMSNEVKGIYFALDVSRRVIEDAIAKGCNLIVTHHPIMFGGRKNLREDDEEGQMLVSLIRNNISVISAHTNYDKAAGGVNDVLALALGIKNPSPIEGDEEGYLRIGEIEPQTLGAFVSGVKNLLGDAVRAYGDPDKLIKKVAVCGGVGGEFANLAYDSGADAYVTGEMRYHDSLDLAQKGFATIQAGHDATEKPAVKRLKELVDEHIKFENICVQTYLSDIDIFSIMRF